MTGPRAWTAEEDAFVRAHYRVDMTRHEIAWHLKRTERSVAHRVVRLGLRKDNLRQINGGEKKTTHGPVAREIARLLAGWR